MNTKINLFVVGFLVSLISCQPLDPCIEQDEYTVWQGDTVLVESCSMNAEVYQWLVDGEEVNLYLDPPAPFFNHYADSGGTSCDGHIRLFFHDTGEFKVMVRFAKLKNSQKCDDAIEFPIDKSEVLSVTVRVNGNGQGTI